jgi:hypothetical protein
MLRGHLPGIVLTLAPTARHAVNIEVSYSAGSYWLPFDLYGVRLQGDGM